MLNFLTEFKFSSHWYEIYSQEYRGFKYRGFLCVHFITLIFDILLCAIRNILKICTDITSRFIIQDRQIATFIQVYFKVVVKKLKFLLQIHFKKFTKYTAQGQRHLEEKVHENKFQKLQHLKNQPQLLGISINGRLEE